jgi:tetratricopeptide (TPR) repeat protein
MLQISLIVFLLATPGSGFSQQDRKGAMEERILQIQQFIAQGNLAGARKLLGEATKQHPAEAGFDNLLGIIEAQEGNYEAAERSFSRATTRARKFTGAYLNLGRLYQEHSAADPQALPKALEVYRRVLQYEPDNAEANYQSATLLMRQGAYQASLDHLSRLPAEIRSSAQALSVSCADYAGLGSRERAVEAAEQLRAHPEFSEPDALTILPALTAARRDDLVVRLLEGLGERQPLSPEMMRHLGLAYERTGKLVEARAALERSVTGDRPSVPLLVELARIAHGQKDYKGALGYLAHARDLEPNNASIHFYFGQVCVDLDLIAEARSAFEKAVKLEPDNSSYNYAMGVTSAFSRDPAEAISYFENYVRLKPQDPRGKLALGAARFKAKDYDGAARPLREAVSAPETATTAHYYLGSIARERGQIDEAVGELEQALKAKPDYPDALAELGQCYLLRKEYETAERYLRRALEINPNHFAANFNLLTLYARTKDDRREAQAKNFERVERLREEKSQELLRIVEIQPFPAP